MSNEELVDQIQKGINTSENMEQLYLQNKGLIFAVVKKYRYACQSDYNSTPIIEMDELMHEAYFGLIKAVEGYNSGQGILFMSYATFWIRQAVKRFLDNSGQVIRVPIHKQEQIYKYNQASAHYLNKYNRKATTREYAMWLEVSEKAIEKLERFVFNKTVKSLDAFIPGEDNDSMTVADSVASDINIEDDVIDKVGNEQLHTQLWELVSQVLKNDIMVKVLRCRFIGRFTLEATGEILGISRERIRQYESLSLRRLRSNTKTRRLGIELGFWDTDRPMNIDNVKEWANKGYIKWLNKKEFDYAIRMGWIREGLERYS